MCCRCYEIENEINEKHPDCNWNMDAACREWGARVSELEDNYIECEAGSEECFACTCPTCGRIIYGWCV